MLNPLKMKNANNNTKLMTVAPVQAGNAVGVPPEWGAHQTATAIYGLKRGMLYALEKEGLITGVSLRRKGQRHGVKLWSMPSIAGYLNALMQEQERNKMSNINSP